MELLLSVCSVLPSLHAALSWLYLPTDLVPITNNNLNFLTFPF